MVKGILKKQLKYIGGKGKGSSQNSSSKKVSFKLDEKVLKILQRHEKKQARKKSQSKKNKTQQTLSMVREAEKSLIQ